MKIFRCRLLTIPEQEERPHTRKTKQPHENQLKMGKNLLTVILHSADCDLNAAAIVLTLLFVIYLYEARYPRSARRPHGPGPSESPGVTWPEHNILIFIKRTFSHPAAVYPTYIHAVYFDTPGYVFPTHGDGTAVTLPVLSFLSNSTFDNV